MKKYLITTAATCCVLLLSGCDVLNPDAAVARLCDEHGKYVVYKQISADGVLIDSAERNYVGFGALNLFNRTQLKYLEVFSANRKLDSGFAARDVDSRHVDYLFSKKYIRVYLADSGSEDCIKWKDGPLSSGGWGQSQLDASNQCIAAVPVEKSTAAYIATVKQIESPKKAITSYRFSVQDSVSGEVVAEAVNFYHTSGSGKFRGTSTCSGYGRKFINHDFSVFALVVQAFPRQ